MNTILGRTMRWAVRGTAALAVLLSAWPSVAQPADGEAPSAIVRRAVHDLFEAGDLPAAERWFAAEMAQEERAFAVALRRAFPDLRLTLDRVVEQRDWVAVRWTARGTHRAPFAGVAATGRAVAWSGAWFWRVDGGRIVEGKAFNVWDRAGLVEQLTRQSGGTP